MVVNSVPEANHSKIKLLIFGEDENARPTELRKLITAFTRKEDSDLMNPIVVVVGEQTPYATLSLYYDDDLIEDYYVRVPKRVVRQIIESVEVAERPPRKTYDIRKDKQKIKTNYTSSKDEDKMQIAGKLLEEVIIAIIELVPGLKVV